MLTPHLPETYTQNYIDMSEEKEIPTQVDNPKGLHQRYSIKKLIQIPNPNYDPSSILGLHEPSIIVEYPVDKDAEYFVLRLDKNGKDPNHINACRIGVQAYANAIEPFIPELAKDLRERYPVEQHQQSPVKTLQECKDEVAVKYGYKDYSNMISRCHKNPRKVDIMCTEATLMFTNSAKGSKTFDQILTEQHRSLIQMLKNEFLHSYVSRSAELYADQFRSQTVPVTEGRSWVSVKDKLPEHELEVLGLTKRGNTFNVECDRKNDDRFYTPYNMDVKFVTHWMPLPSPPTH